MTPPRSTPDVTLPESTQRLTTGGPPREVWAHVIGTATDAVFTDPHVADKYAIRQPMAVRPEVHRYVLSSPLLTDAHRAALQSALSMPDGPDRWRAMRDAVESVMGDSMVANVEWLLSADRRTTTPTP